MSILKNILFLMLIIVQVLPAQKNNPMDIKYAPIVAFDLVLFVPVYLKGIEKIQQYAIDDSIKTLLVSDYENANIIGVNSKNIDKINQVIKTKTAEEVNSVEKIQTLVDNEKIIISGDKIIAYAHDSNSSVPLLEDYQRIGVRCVTKENILKVNNAIFNSEDINFKDQIQHIVNTANGIESIILDNDAFDPDWVIMLTTALGLQENCEVSIAGVVLTGRDVNRKQGMMYSSVLYYYGQKDIPLGLNSKQTMRFYSLDATRDTPKHIDYKGNANSIEDFESDECIDYEWCWGRNESTDMLCTILENTKEKINWVVGGHLHNVANLLKETEVCNGKELVKNKIKQIVISSGWKDRINGDPEMNLSEGTTKANSATDATKYLFGNRPSSLPIIMASVPESSIVQSRVGDIYRDNIYKDTPMAFILSVPRYGVYGDHGLSDTEALMYAVRGNKSNEGTYYTKKIKTCFNLNKYGAVMIGNNCNKEDYFLEKTTQDYTKILDMQVSGLLKIIPKVLK